MSNDEIIDGLVDILAAIEHSRWSHWQRYLHSRCLPQPDGSLLIPADLVKHWKRQTETPFEKLTEAEKESDRQQVQEYLPIIKAALR